MEISHTTWADLIKRRVEKADCLRNGWLIEGFPKTRRQAYTLRKIGIFPTHIVVIEDAVINYQGAQYEEDRKELLQYAGQKSLILDLHRSSYMKKFIIGKYSEAHTSLNKVVEFVRSSQRPSLPYLPRVLLFGPYGSGRKTMAKMLAEKYNLVQVDYQEELRKAALKDTPLKQKFYEILKTSEPGNLLVTNLL
ncbi:adenylate kinase 8-like [Parasteatoda tepidariorum]|uniref:adenylate kinase 8-like n=1 Tax=Parasteatoda tepidariorum TaxID=114398 RepID=UPI0039BCF832